MFVFDDKFTLIGRWMRSVEPHASSLTVLVEETPQIAMNAPLAKMVSVSLSTFAVPIDRINWNAEINIFMSQFTRPINPIILDFVSGVTPGLDSDVVSCLENLGPVATLMLQEQHLVDVRKLEMAGSGGPSVELSARILRPSVDQAEKMFDMPEFEPLDASDGWDLLRTGAERGRMIEHRFYGQNVYSTPSRDRISWRVA